MAPASVDFIYWTFSAAAQSISAFVALLLTGYALVHGLMEGARERDDSLDEIHNALRRTYHARLSLLAILTASAIVLSLLVVYVNRPASPVAGWALAFVAGVDLAAIVAGLHFVVSIVDPRKYQRAAEKAIEKAADSGAGRSSPAGEFFDAFLHLERLVREYVQTRELSVTGRGTGRLSYSFRQMLETLRANERIDGDFYRELLELNGYRNLVFHGHLSEVDGAMVRRTEAAGQRVADLP